MKLVNAMYDECVSVDGIGVDVCDHRYRRSYFIGYVEVRSTTTMTLITLANGYIGYCRYMQLRRRNQSLRGFFSRSHRHGADNESSDDILSTRERRQSLPRTTGLPRPHTMSGSSVPVSTAFFYPPCLTHGPYPEPLEPATAHLARSVSLPGLDRGRRSERRGRRAARGADIDARGRRGGQPDPDDWDGDDKEELPAYESVAVGGPPRYADVHFVAGMPVRVVTLPASIPEEREGRESTSLEREVAVERALQRELTRDSSGSTSPDRPRARESESAGTSHASPQR